MKVTFDSKSPKGNAYYQYLSTFTATLSILASGMHYAWPSPSLPKLTSESNSFPVSNEEGSSIAVLTLIGAVFGSFVSGALLDRIGRKKVILLTGPTFFASWIMIANASNIYVIFAARFVAGLGDGFAFTAVPMYIGEIADPSIRGFLGSSCVTIMILGMLFVQTIGSYFTISTAAYISSFILVLLVSTFSFMPESPYFCLMRDDYETAKKNMRLLKGLENVDSELNRIQFAIQEQNKNTGRFLDLFTVASNRRAVCIMLGLRTVQQLSGITAFTFYANTIFHEAGGNISPQVTSLIYFSVQLLVTTLSSIILDRAGRRPLIILSVAGAAVCLLTEGVYFFLDNLTDVDTTPFDFVPAVALILFIVVFSIGLQTIPVLLLGELFPTNVKAFALSLADIYFSLIAAAVAKFFQFVKDEHGMHVPFFAFAGFCVLGTVFVYYIIPETKDRTLEDIQLILRGQSLEEKKQNLDSPVV